MYTTYSKAIMYFIILIVITFPVVGIKFYKRENYLGILLSLAIAIVAWQLGKMMPLIGSAVFAILIGIIIALKLPPAKFKSGINATSKKVLQAAIILFGFEMDIANVYSVGSQSLILMIASLTAAFITAFFMAKVLKIDKIVGILIGVGTAICGGSAIAATAPILRADDKQIASSIATIFLFNILAVFVFPAVGYALNMSDVGFGMWAGTAINDTSSVVAAGYSYSDDAGKLATIVKLTRSLMIIPISIVLAIYVSKKERDKNTTFSIKNIFPWFILGFLAACIINSINVIPKDLSIFLGNSGKFFVAFAMAAIGLNTNIKALIDNGKKSILMGLICWVAVALTALFVQKFTGLL